jgi:hypothetical protein
LNATPMLAGAEVGCRYRWPNDACHPDCWRPPLKGVVMNQTDPRAWQRTLAFPCRDGAMPDADKVKAHVEGCHGQGLLNDKVPVLYQGVDASGPFIQWDDLDSLLPYKEMLSEWEKAKAEKVDAIERQRREQIKELRAEIRKTRAEMNERRIKRTSCFNRIDGDTYRFNATMFQLETRLKSLLGGEQ